MKRLWTVFVVVVFAYGSADATRTEDGASVAPVGVFEGDGDVGPVLHPGSASYDPAARRLWERYFADLVRLARTRLRDVPRAADDEEDAARSAFNSLRRGAEHGRFSRLNDRDDLWRALVTVTARKAADLAQPEPRLIRGGGHVRTEADLAAAALDVGGIGQAPASEPSAGMAALPAEECRRLFDALPDESLRVVAQLRLEGYTNQEIAAFQDCSLSTVERRLRTIRAPWSPRGSHEA